MPSRCTRSFAARSRGATGKWRKTSPSFMAAASRRGTRPSFSPSRTSMAASWEAPRWWRRNLSLSVPPRTRYSVGPRGSTERNEFVREQLMQVESILIVVHVLAAIGVTGLVLLQRGKGAEIGASFGSGASQTIFGSVGSGNFLTRTTTLLTVVFFATSLGLAIIASQRAQQTVQDDLLLSGDILLEQQQQQQQNSGAQNAPAGDLPQ